MVMLHSHLCAAFCASGIYSCCKETEQVKDCCKKSCCDEKKNEKQDDGCQKEHLAMLTTLGQFHFLKTVDAKIFQPLVSILISKQYSHPVISADLVFAYNGFHPPPPKENIIILKQSFLI